MINVIITGRVQGVGFRQYVKYKARKLNIIGWVKNLPASTPGGSDGKVEAMLDGSQENLNIMLKILRKGPMTAEVKHVEVIHIEGKIESNLFEVIK